MVEGIRDSKVEYITPAMIVKPLEYLYFSDGVGQLLSDSELFEEVDAYYCKIQLLKKTRFSMS